ncbi:MAG: PHB depolymerase family esterase [Ilumatobacteraceae bacterium]
MATRCRAVRWCAAVLALGAGAGACASNGAEAGDPTSLPPVTSAPPRSTAAAPSPSSPSQPAATASPATSGPTVPAGSAPGTLAASTVPTTVPPTLPPITTLPPDCVGLAPVTSGSRVHVTASGEQRTYELAVPRSYDGTRAAGLIVNFHEHTSSGAQHDRYTQMGELATTRGYIVVSPDAIGDPTSWNARFDSNRLDDFGFAHGLVAELLATMCIDPARVYAAGHANGGLFAGHLVCSPPFEFAAVAVVAAVPLSSCPAEVRPSVALILGTADELTPYFGSLTRPSAVESVLSWARHAGCAEPATVVPVVNGVEAMRFDGCAGVEVRLLSVVDGAHPWPGGLVARTRAGNSDSGRTFPATETILDFFDRHVRV